MTQSTNESELRIKSYRLIKSLPGVKEGAYIHQDGIEIKILDHDGYVSYHIDPSKHPNWFKEVGKYIKGKGWETIMTPTNKAQVIGEQKSDCCNAGVEIDYKNYFDTEDGFACDECGQRCSTNTDTDE